MIFLGNQQSLTQKTPINFVNKSVEEYQKNINVSFNIDRVFTIRTGTITT